MMLNQNVSRCKFICNRNALLLQCNIHFTLYLQMTEFYVETNLKFLLYLWFGVIKHKEHLLKSSFDHFNC